MTSLVFRVAQCMGWLQQVVVVVVVRLYDCFERVRTWVEAEVQLHVARTTCHP